MQNADLETQEAARVSAGRGISGSTLKMVGIVTMFIDHFAAALLLRVLLRDGYTQNLYRIYWFMREVGRLGFPIFCFLLVEGFQNTRSRKKYALRLGMFALISEIPFDLAFSAVPLEFENQNVYFTLLLGLLALWAYDFLSKCQLPGPVRIIAQLAVMAVTMSAADLLRTDYAGMGVLTIVVMYILRRSGVRAMAGGCAVLSLMDAVELPAFFALLPVAAYNGKRGMKLKYFFYVFYPAHLLILWLIAVVLGMGEIVVI